jgi:hypothetical protein
MISPFFPIALNNKSLKTAEQPISKQQLFIVKTQVHGSTLHGYFTSSME